MTRMASRKSASARSWTSSSASRSVAADQACEVQECLQKAAPGATCVLSTSELALPQLALDPGRKRREEAAPKRSWRKKLSRQRKRAGGGGDGGGGGEGQ